MKSQINAVAQYAFFFLLLSTVTVICAADSGEDDSSYYNQFSVCADSKVVVEDMSLYCDSPGSYYYGSNKYRNSATCQAGDKAKLQIQFQITEDLETDPVLTVDVEGYGTVEGVSVYKTVSFCNTVTAKNGAVCPGAGYYYAKGQFYWGSQNDNYEYSFVPKTVVGVASSASSNSYDLGGANTNHCYSGNTFSNWTVGVRKSAANTFSTFVITFGILFISICAIACCTYCIVKESRRREYYKESDTAAKNIIVDEDIIVDEINDYHRIVNLIGKEKGLFV